MLTNWKIEFLSHAGHCVFQALHNILVLINVVLKLGQLFTDLVQEFPDFQGISVVWIGQNFGQSLKTNEMSFINLSL